MQGLDLCVIADASEGGEKSAWFWEGVEESVRKGVVRLSESTYEKVGYKP